MNACAAFASELDDVASGAEPRSELKHHLATCDPCRAGIGRRQELLSRIDASARTWMAAQPSPYLTARILARIDAERGRHGSSRAPWSFAAVGAFAALLAFGGYEGALHAIPRVATPAVSQWHSPTSTLLPQQPSVLDLRSRGRLLDGDTHAV